MTTLEYWQAREQAWLEYCQREEQDFEKKLNGILDQLKREIVKQVEHEYVSLARRSDLTLADVQEQVSKMDVKAFSAKAKEYVNNRDFSVDANEQLRIYNATMRINRLELLKSEIGLQNVAAFDDVEKNLKTALIRRTVEEYRRQAGILGEAVPSDAELLESVRSVVNGSFETATWSERLWNVSSTFQSTVATSLRTALIQGLNPKTIGDWAKNYLTEKGIKSSRANIDRLMRTEMARVQEDAQKRSYQRFGYDRYVFIALMEGAGATHTCTDCRSINGQIFRTADMEPGLNAPPMHPNCRCSTAAYADREGMSSEPIEESAFIYDDIDLTNVDMDWWSRYI